jgi:hypothetical protein
MQTISECYINLVLSLTSVYNPAIMVDHIQTIGIDGCCGLEYFAKEVIPNPDNLSESLEAGLDVRGILNKTRLFFNEGPTAGCLWPLTDINSSVRVAKQLVPNIFKGFRLLPDNFHIEQVAPELYEAINLDIIQVYGLKYAYIVSKLALAFDIAYL